MNPDGNRSAVQAAASQQDLVTRQPTERPSEPIRTTPDQAWRQLLTTARDRYRDCGRFAWSFAGGKLGWDPVFRHLLEQGRIPAGSRVVDIGCGQGLLASLLAAVDDAQRHGNWPLEWAPPPVDCRYTGIELMQRDVDRANHALAGLSEQVRVIGADMIDAELPHCDVVVILDVLHYVSQANQQAVLERVHRQLDAGGRLVLRIGDQASRRGFAASQWADRLITSVRGHRVAPTFCRPLADWTTLLEGLGFVRLQQIPMSRGTPFANVLLVADKP